MHKRFDKPLAGIFGLGGIVPCKTSDKSITPDELPSLGPVQADLIKRTPKLIYIGDSDEFFSVPMAYLSYDVIR